MRHIFLVFCLLCTVLPCLGAKYALLVGIADYKNIGDLKYTEADVKAVQKTLIESAGFDRDAVRVMTGDKNPDDELYPTNVNVHKQLGLLANKIKPDDLFVFYFSGHGYQMPEGHFLATINADPSDIETMSLTCLSLESLRRAMRKIKARQVVFVLDACRNDPAPDGKGVGDNRMKEGFARDWKIVAAEAGDGQAKTALLLSCREGERSWEWETKKQGVYTYFLVEGLKGAAAEADGQVTVYSLQKYVEKQVENWCLDNKPQRTNWQHPDYKVEGGAELVIGRPIKPVVEAAKAKLALQGTAGATVEVDGVRQGKTIPCVLELDLGPLAVKTVKVAVSLRGFKPQEKIVNLTKGQNFQTEFNLLPLLANLTVHGTPGAFVFVDGVVKGQVPCELELTPPEGALKPVKVSVSMQGFIAEDRQVTLTPGQKSNLNVMLKPQPNLPIGVVQTAKLSLRGTAWASVEVDGVKLGKKVPCEVDVELGAARTKTVAVRVSRAGYVAETRQVLISRDKPADIEVKLQLEPIVVKTKTNAKDGATMVWVPAGEFVRGALNDEPGEKPVRQIYLDGFWMYQTEVTVRQYRAFCVATGRAMPREPEWKWKDNHPIVNVSWEDANAYAQWAGASLPTEAQWEKAARGYDERFFPWGSQFSHDRLVDSSFAPDLLFPTGSTADVALFPNGKSPFGCLHLAGNASEWCADWFDPAYYEQAPAQNPAGPPTGERRVMRGGGWRRGDENSFRASKRSSLPPTTISIDLGFRCIQAQP